MGTISLQKLSRAMKLGKLGEQIVLKSSRAFERISYKSSEPAPASHYYPMKVHRDLAAREQYMDLRTNGSRLDDIYILDGGYDRIDGPHIFGYPDFFDIPDKARNVVRRVIRRLKLDA